MSRSKTSDENHARHYWGAVAAATAGVVFFAFVASTGLIYANSPAYECEAQSEQHEAQSEAFSFRAEERESYRLDYNPQQHKERETCAWGHNAEQWLALLTLWLVAGTVLLAGFTAFLWLDASEAARKQRDADRIAHARQLRAYVGIKAITLTVKTHNNESEVTAHVQVENFGQTPAYQVRTYGHFELLPNVISPFFPVTEMDEAASRASLGPRAERARSTKLASTIDLRTIEPDGDKAADSMLLYWGVFVYDDVFGETHRTYFKGTAGGSAPLQPGVPTRFGLEHRLITYRNGNDAD